MKLLMLETIEIIDYEIRLRLKEISRNLKSMKAQPYHQENVKK